MRHRLRRLPSLLRHIRPWYFLVLALVSGAVCVFALRANNEHMMKLRDAVYAADKNNGDVQTALNDLQAYVTAHMNTNLSSGPNAVYPPIQLKYTYDRLVQAQSEATTNNNTRLYSEAQAHCEAINHTDFSGRNRVPCITEYIQSHTVKPGTPIPDALYKFSFVSPKWSPDLAGWSLLITILSLIAFVLTLGYQKLLHRQSPD
jgi:hypothetical protein